MRKRQIWKAYDVRDPENVGDIGLIVSEPGDLDRLIAFIDTSWNHMEDERALKIARLMARDPNLADCIASSENYIYDLTRCGRLDSINEVPPIIYTLAVRGLGCKNTPKVRLCPYCPVLAARMSETYRRLASTTEGRSEKRAARRRATAGVSGRGFFPKEESGTSEPHDSLALAGNRGIEAIGSTAA